MSNLPRPMELPDLKPLVLPSRTFDDGSSSRSSTRHSPLARSPLAWRLHAPEVNQKLVESGVIDEVEQIVSDLQEVEEELGELKVENLKLRETVDSGEMEMSAKYVELVQLQGGLMAAKQEKNALKDENVKLQQVLMTELTELQEAKQKALQQYLDLQTEHETTLGELQESRNEIRQLTNQVNQLQEKLIAVVERSIDNQNNLQTAFFGSGVHVEVKNMQDKLNECQQEKMSLWVEIGRLQADLSLAESERNDLENLLRELFVRRAAHKTEQSLTELKAELLKVELAVKAVKNFNGEVFLEDVRKQV